MLDRQDIDALLMGSLYGELSPAESTRLEEHLSAHPQDKLVLDGLSRARQALKDSLILAVHAEPPAAVSALLLQEAARRAPAPRQHRVGWFAKLVAVMRHPAVAAATVIVLVAAVGGTIYLKSGDRAVVEHEVTSATPADQRAERSLGPASEQRAVAAGSAAGSATVVAPSTPPSVADQTRDGDSLGYTADLAPTDPRDSNAAENGTDSGGKADVQLDGKQAAPTAKKVPHKGYIDVDVHAPELAPKELEGDTASTGHNDEKKVATTKPSAAERGDGTAPDKNRGAKTTSTIIISGDTPSTSTNGELSMGGDGLTGTAPGGSAGGTSAGGAPAQPSPPPESTTAGIVDEAASKDKAAELATAAAKAQHTKLVNLVKANKCAEAGKVGSDLFEHYPDYYGRYVANDRKVKACKPYIENARKKKAEAAKRQRSDQAQDAPSPDSMKVTE